MERLRATSTSRTRARSGGIISSNGKKPLCFPAVLPRLHTLNRHFEDKGHWWTFARKSDFLRWTLTLVTGILCGLVALFVTFFTKALTRRKLAAFYALLEREKAGDISFGAAYLFLFVCNLFFGSLAWFTVFLEPLAAGSGIPEVKCFLNGLNIPRLVRFKTLACKAVGIVFSCSSGLPLGKEGPMVHIGAVIAAGVSQVRCRRLA